MAGNSSDKIGYMYAYLSTNRPIAWWGDNKRCSPEMAASWKPGFVCRTISDEEFEKSDENIWLVDDTDAGFEVSRLIALSRVPADHPGGCLYIMCRLAGILSADIIV